LGHVKEPISCSSLRADGKICMYSFLPSLIEASRAAWCGAPLEMKEGTIWIWGLQGLGAVTLMTIYLYVISKGGSIHGLYTNVFGYSGLSLNILGPDVP
jgi:hypothetical protein